VDHLAWLLIDGALFVVPRRGIVHVHLLFTADGFGGIGLCIARDLGWQLCMTRHTITPIKGLDRLFSPAKQELDKLIIKGQLAAALYYSNPIQNVGHSPA
jgi:hypothetical protein